MSEQIPWHALSADEVVARLHSSITHGLSHHEAKDRLKQYGLNTLPAPKRRSFLSIFFHQFLSPLIYLLLVAAGIALFISEPKDATVILVVVFLNAVIGSIQEGRAEQSLDMLRNLSKLKAQVLRGGQEQLVEASELVPGDILVLNAGDAIASDARLVNASSLALDEASLTGESMPVRKSIVGLDKNDLLGDRKNMVYAGTYITAGRGLAVVVTTGLSNEIGKIATLTTSTIQPKTQLELRLKQFGRYLIAAAMILFVLVIGMGIYRGIPFAQIFMIAISQMVSLVPEGLPVAMTVAFAVGVQRMAKRGTIVRRLSAVETLGSTTVICTDKTGTLTRNEMTVTSVYLPASDREISVSGVGHAPEGHFLENGFEINPVLGKTFGKLFEVCCLCNDARLIAPDATDPRWKILGDPTEGALLTLAVKANIDPLSIRKKFPRIAELPFNPDVKMMATQHEIDGKNVIFIKGAPESIFECCSTVYHDGYLVEFDEILRKKTKSVARNMANSALRVLALGFIDDAFINGSQEFAPFMGKVTLVGLVGELDPPRDEVAISVRECQMAGIRPVMVTGDHKGTGLAIAKALGISSDHDLAIDGHELDQLSDEELEQKLDRISVFARVHPAQKLRIVEAYQKRGEVVAMTGDGVNDAPALVRANVGVAMGITGTEVAKEAAKIVITDDNFQTIVSAISEGRLVYQNIKKLLLFLFVTSIDEVVILFLALLFGYTLPLAAVQILWINLVTEGTLTINLIMEPPEGDEMRRPPIPSDRPLLDKALLSRIPLMVMTSVIATFGWFVYRSSLGVPHALLQTETFTMLSVCQWFNVFNCRSATKSTFSRDLFKNHWLLVGLILSNALQVTVVYWHPLAKFFHAVPIGIVQFFTIGAIASFVLWSEEFRKLIVRKYTNKKLIK